MHWSGLLDILSIHSQTSKAGTARLHFGCVQRLYSLAHPLTRLQMKICNLNLSNSESQFVRAIAGLRYVRAADSVRISTSANETMVENKRQLYEQAVALVLEAKHLAAKHGEIDLAELGLCQEKSGQKSLKKRQRRQRQMRK